MAIALENERKAKEEVEKLREEMRAERASVQAARVIQRQKREVEIKRQMNTFSHSQEAVNQRLDSLVTSLSHLSKVQVEIGGRKLGKHNFLAPLMHSCLYSNIITLCLSLTLPVVLLCTDNNILKSAQKPPLKSPLSSGLHFGF